MADEPRDDAASGPPVFTTLSRDNMPIQLIIPHGLPVQYANKALVQTTAEEVLVSFFYVGLPLVQSQEEFDRLDSVPAFCVSRIVLTPAHAAEFLASLQGAVQAFQAKQGG